MLPRCDATSGFSESLLQVAVFQPNNPIGQARKEVVERMWDTPNSGRFWVILNAENIVTQRQRRLEVSGHLLARGGRHKSDSLHGEVLL